MKENCVPTADNFNRIIGLSVATFIIQQKITTFMPFSYFCLNATSMHSINIRSNATTFFSFDFCLKHVYDYLYEMVVFIF